MAEHTCLCGKSIPHSCDVCQECFDTLYPNAPMKRYRLIRINDRTGARIPLSDDTLTHDEALTMLSKQCDWPQFPFLRNMIEPV